MTSSTQETEGSGASSDYTHPEMLVSTQWVHDHLNYPKMRIVESYEDVLLYEQGHIPGAVKLDWHTDLQDDIVRDYINRERFEKICSERGISNDTLLIFYGDKNNWWATY